jgi:hypothetical protein
MEELKNAYSKIKSYYSSEIDSSKEQSLSEYKK